MQHFHSIIFQDLKELHWWSIISPSFFIVMLRPTWLHIPGCLILGQWSQHRDYLGREDFSGIAFLWILATSSSYLLLLLGPHRFCLYRAHLCMKWSHGISHFLDEIFNLFHSVVSLYFLRCGLLRAFLSLLAILWNDAFSGLYLSFSPLLFFSLLFTAICKASSESDFAFLPFFFFGMILIPVPVQCHEPPSIVHQALCQI